MQAPQNEPSWRSRLTDLCRIVIAASVGCFAAGWVVGAWIVSDAIDAPAGIYDRPLGLMRSDRVRYITVQEEQVMAVVMPGMFASIAFAMVAGVLMGALDEARRDEERAKSKQLAS